ncbi:uncharacterized protein LOC120627658 [Pararge aegeria]|uniref:uncharacterized protein LOC120627658 n=1 Tax=Pararge aegeria TaxID=116150 RepID=UPI0019D18D41|nr:uncharacterized protein LOC120627658 [Pararge aegeria]
MNSFNVDIVVKYVKNIADNSQCVSCGQHKGLRVRYPCGHSVCDNCVLTAENCVLCLSPQDVLTHVNDGPLSLRVENASNLLHTFQELYKLDVYRRLRVSEQLQLEKQLFPECIQAPSKYFNSKRSSNISIINKENILPSVLPGENISKPNMENKMNYVQQWLKKNETSLSEANNCNLSRKPFTDISVNGQNALKSKTPNKVYKNKQVFSRNKNILKNSDLKDKSKLSLKRIRKDIEMNEYKEAVNCNQMKCEKNESGIVIDDEVLIIDDTQSLDKDKKAWLAVIEAEKNCTCEDISVTKFSKSASEIVINKFNTDKQIQSGSDCKIPFYRKSSLLKLKYNKHFDKNENKTSKKSSENNNFTITIDNDSFVTTIKVYEEEGRSKDITKYSIGVQTEDQNNFESNSGNFAEHVKCFIENDDLKENHHNNILTLSKNVDAKSDHLYKKVALMETNPKHTKQLSKETKCLIIDDSDSDCDILLTGKDSLLEVTAEVHRSETENYCSVLSQLEPGEYEHRMKKAVRGHTPASTDSSDKENYDPNRVKRRKLDKKSFKK